MGIMKLPARSMPSFQRIWPIARQMYTLNSTESRALDARLLAMVIRPGASRLEHHEEVLIPTRIERGPNGDRGEADVVAAEDPLDHPAHQAT